MTTTIRMVVQAVLCLSLVVAFTTSAAAALCLQMERHGPMSMSDRTVVMGSSERDSGTEVMFMAAGPVGSPSAHACCHQQVSTPQGVTAPQRALPGEQTVALPARVERLSENAYLPPRQFDPALEKRDHLTPSLTVLSISRT